MMMKVKYTVELSIMRWLDPVIYYLRNGFCTCIDDITNLIIFYLKNHPMKEVRDTLQQYPTYKLKYIKNHGYIVDNVETVYPEDIFREQLNEFYQSQMSNSLKPIVLQKDQKKYISLYITSSNGQLYFREVRSPWDDEWEVNVLTTISLKEE